MPFTPNDLFLGVVIPGAAGFCICMILRRFLSDLLCSRYGVPLAFAVAFTVGYAALRPGPVLPEKQWHWLPAICLVGSLCSTVASRTRLRMMLQVMLWLIVSLVAADLLTPVRDSLHPKRIVWLIVWPLLVVISTWFSQWVFRRIDARSTGMILCQQFCSGCVLLLMSGSLRFSQLALIGFGAVLGLFFYSWPQSRNCTLTHTGFLSGLLLWGLMLTGRVNSSSEIPLICYLLIPPAPVVLWFRQLPSASQQNNRNSMIRNAGLAAIPCLFSVGIATYFYLH